MDFEITAAKSWWSDEMRRLLAVNNGYHHYNDDDASPCERFVSDTQQALGFCGCGQPEAIARHMFRYMRYAGDPYRKANDFSFKEYEARHPITKSDVFWFCAYLASNLNWTEHGGGVSSAWLLPAGEEWLREANEYAAELLGDEYAAECMELKP